MNAKRIAGALIVSLVIHGIIILIGSTVYITQTAQFKDAVIVELLSSKKTPLPQVRRPLRKFASKPSIPIDRPFLVEQVQIQPRGTSDVIVRASSIQPETVLEVSNKVVKMDSAIQPTIPRLSVRRRS